LIGSEIQLLNEIGVAPPDSRGADMKAGTHAVSPPAARLIGSSMLTRGGPAIRLLRRSEHPGKSRKQNKRK
jgi:hypothetical protein